MSDVKVTWDGPTIRGEVNRIANLTVEDHARLVIRLHLAVVEDGGIDAADSALMLREIASRYPEPSVGDGTRACLLRAADLLALHPGDES